VAARGHGEGESRPWAASEQCPSAFYRLGSDIYCARREAAAARLRLLLPSRCCEKAHPPCAEVHGKPAARCTTARPPRAAMPRRLLAAARCPSIAVSDAT
jgi:hypothetical protein